MINAVIPASGVGTRFGATIPKQFLELNGEPILKRTISAFQNLEIVNEITVAVPRKHTNIIENYGFSKVRHIVEGGCHRADSVYTALKMLPANTQIVLIHDGVRPFVSQLLIQTVINYVKIYGAAVACAAVTDTIKTTDESGKIINTLDRSQLWSAQTPQGFVYDIIMRAYEQGEKDGVLNQVTDDSALVERLGIPVYVVPWDATNIKITTKTDLMVAETFAQRF